MRLYVSVFVCIRVYVRVRECKFYQVGYNYAQTLSINQLLFSMQI